MARGGMLPLTADAGPGAVRRRAAPRTAPVVVPLRLDLAALRAAGDGARRCCAAWSARPARAAAARPAPAALRRAARRAARRPSASAALLDLVRAQVAAVLGHAGAGRGRRRAGRSASWASTR